MIRATRRRFPCVLFGVLTLVQATSAHDLERTQVTLSIAADGAFVLDVANDPNWLLLRLESFASQSPGDAVPPATGGTTPAARDARLRALADVFIDRVVLFVDGHEVRPRSALYLAPRAQTAADALPPLATFRLGGYMPADARTLRWLYGLVIDPYPLTLHRADGAVSTEWIHGSNWSGVLDLSGQFRRTSRWDVMRQYLALGYTHILPKGLDHILFVLGLFLLSLRARPILIQVTTFTVAHSITLGLTILGILSLPSSVVEPLIALSIAYVAVENLLTSELKPWRLALVFLFGLLHGMGFAGVLAELGLPRDQFLTALMSFNLGVEGGQLTVVFLATLCVFAYRRNDWYRKRVVMPASVVIAAIGVYWTIVRLIES